MLGAEGRKSSASQAMDRNSVVLHGSRDIGCTDIESVVIKCIEVVSSLLREIVRDWRVRAHRNAVMQTGVVSGIHTLLP